MQTIQINLPDNLVANMNAAVEAGIYNTQDEIACFAISEWNRHREYRLAELRALCTEGEASGNAEPFTLEELLEKVRKKTAENKSC